MDWSSLLVPLLVGALSSLPVSVVKNVPIVANLLKASQVPWLLKVGAALAVAGQAGAQLDKFLNGSDSNVPIAYLAGALGSLLTYQFIQKVLPSLEKRLRGLGEQIPLGKPVVVLPEGVPVGTGSGPGGLMPPTVADPVVVVGAKDAIVAVHPDWTDKQVKNELTKQLLERGYSSGW